MVILLISAVVMLVLARADSLTMDELAHIPSGYSYVRYLDFRLNPEHPPILKALSGFPLLFMDVKFPTESPKWLSEINAQWDLGRMFIFESGNDSSLLIFLARLGPILLTLLLIWFIYRWSKEMVGGKWALLPALLIGLSPNFLSHGHYVTTDIVAAFGIAFATYYFLRFLANPSGKNVFCAGLAFGLAQLSKFSAVLLLPYFVILIILKVLNLSIAQEEKFSWKRFFSLSYSYISRTIVSFIIGFLLLVYPIYGLFTWNYPIEKQVADTTSILQSFANGPTPPGQLCQPTRCLADMTIWMSGNHLTRPLAEYSLGVLMVMQRSAGGNNNYFMGNVSASGSHFYFPAVYLMKEPLPILLMVLGALVFGIWRIKNIRKEVPPGTGFWRKTFAWIDNNFTESALLLFVVLYWLYSIRSPLNIGFRHLFPTLPFIYLLIANSWQRHHLMHPAGKTSRYVLAILIIWLGLETAYVYPNYLSYFNPVAGGTSNGYRYVTDSNYDWGQDLLRLKSVIVEYNQCAQTKCDANSGVGCPSSCKQFIGSDIKHGEQIDKFAIDYFGGSHIPYYFGDRAVSWWSSKGDPRAEGIHWLVLAANSIQGSIQPTINNFERKPEDEYRWLTSERPFTDSGMGAIPKWDLRAGTSLFIYRLP